MSRYKTLKSLHTLLDSFLTRAVELKEHRLSVLEGINRLDDIARESSEGADKVDRVGDWFAEHNRWLTENNLKPADIRRINGILHGFKEELGLVGEASAAEDKIQTEIKRWGEAEEKVSHKLTFKRAPEISVPSQEPEIDTITLFDNKLTRLLAVFRDHTHNKKHILSVVDDLLKSADTQNNKDALLLSGFAIYYLKQNGYKVEPYVKRLKEAETKFAKGVFNA